MIPGGGQRLDGVCSSCMVCFSFKLYSVWVTQTAAQQQGLMGLSACETAGAARTFRPGRFCMETSKCHHSITWSCHPVLLIPCSGHHQLATEKILLFSASCKWAALACCAACEACLCLCASVEVKRFVSLAMMFHSWESFSLSLHTARLRVTKPAAHANGHEFKHTALRSTAFCFWLCWCC